MSKDSLFQQSKFDKNKKSNALTSRPKPLEKPLKTIKSKEKTTHKCSLEFILDVQVKEKEECWIQKFTLQRNQNSN